MSKILLIDDDLNLRHLLKTLLEMDGHQVLAPDVRSAEAVQSAFHNERPDFLLMDVHLHGLDGVQILRDLVASGQPYATRIIMSSGMDVRERCLAAGAHSFLLKPYMPDELYSLIRTRQPD